MHYGIVYQRQNQQVQSEIPGTHGFFFFMGSFCLEYLLGLASGVKAITGKEVQTHL